MTGSITASTATSRPATAAARQPVPCRLHLRGRDPRRQLPVKASVEPFGNGVRIKLGDPDKMSTSASTAMCIRYRATRADRPLQATMTSSTGTSPATAGSSRSTSPRPGSACPQPAKFGAARRLHRPARLDRVQCRSGRREAGRDHLPDHPAARPLRGPDRRGRLPEGRRRRSLPRAARSPMARRLRAAAARLARPASACALSITSRGSAPAATRARARSCRSSRRPTT